jgi:hypothetical protein
MNPGEGAPGSGVLRMFEEMWQPCWFCRKFALSLNIDDFQSLLFLAL